MKMQIAGFVNSWFLLFLFFCFFPVITTLTSLGFQICKRSLKLLIVNMSGTVTVASLAQILSLYAIVSLDILYVNWTGVQLEAKKIESVFTVF